jgi:hypothetical protein
MALLTIQTITRSGTGLTPALVAAAGGGDTFVNTGAQFVEINNASGAPITVTFAIPFSVEGQTIPGKAVAIPAGQRRFIGPWPVSYYNDASTPSVLTMTYSGVTSLTVGVFQFQPV